MNTIIIVDGSAIGQAGQSYAGCGLADVNKPLVAVPPAGIQKYLLTFYKITCILGLTHHGGKPQLEGEDHDQRLER